MPRIAWWCGLFVRLLWFVGLQGCGDRPVEIVEMGSDAPLPARDAGAPKPPEDRPTIPDAADPTTKALDYVLSRLLLPADWQQGLAFGVDFDGDGSVDNQLGSVFSALAAIVPEMALQYFIDDAINRGQAVSVLRLRAPSLDNTPEATVELWRGDPTRCCAAIDPTQCAVEASEGCFGGAHLFSVSADQEPSVFAGRITAGSGLFEAKGEILWPQPLGGMKLVLRGARLEGRTSEGQLAWSLAGGISETNVRRHVVPFLHAVLNSAVDDPPDGQTRAQILQLFDANSDGRISVDEVQNSDLLKVFFQGDVDVDGDGRMEVSVGVGLNAVGAQLSFF